MDSFELNKIVAAVIVVFVVIFGIGKISYMVFHVDKPNKSAYKVEVSSATASKVSGTSQSVDISALLAMGDIDHGKNVFKKCRV